MNGELQYNDSLINALSQQNQMQQKQDMLQNAMSQQNGWSGGLGMLGQALMGIANNRNNKKMGDNDASIQQQIAQQQREHAQALESKNLAKQDKAFKLKVDDLVAAGVPIEKAPAIARGSVSYSNIMPKDKNDLGNQRLKFDKNKFEYQKTQDEIAYQQKQDEIANDRYEAEQKTKNGGSQLYTPKQQAIIAQNPELEDKIKQEIINEEIGEKNKPLSDTVKNKLSFIKNARKKLSQYKKEAFIDGDYQEIGSKFGNTNNLLTEAVRNKLRAESGAAISDQELESEKELFDPSMFRSDETNLAKINEFEKTLQTLEDELTGGNPQQSQPTQTAINPRTGERVGLINGEWVKIDG